MARIQSVPELERRLSSAIGKMTVLVATEPDPPLQSILRQLEALAESTQNGAPPSPDEKSRFNFGLLASRHLADLDPPLAAELYEIASWVTYW